MLVLSARGACFLCEGLLAFSAGGACFVCRVCFSAESACFSAKKRLLSLGGGVGFVSAGGACFLRGRGVLASSARNLGVLIFFAGGVCFL